MARTRIGRQEVVKPRPRLKPKATENKAKDVEIKESVFFKLSDPLRQAAINYIANSVPRFLTVQEACNLGVALRELEEVKNDSSKENSPETEKKEVVEDAGLPKD